MRNDRKNIIAEKTVEFALQIIDFCQELKKQNHFEISSQLIRSGTSIGANVFEAQNGASNRDFLNKMKIAAKECDETMFWFIVCYRSKHLVSPDKEMNENLESITKILSKIISTTKKKLN